MSKTAFITGGSRGIGAAIALELARKGFQVAVSCSSPATAESAGAAVVSACREMGVKAACYAGDISDFEGCAEMIGKVKEEFGSLDVLVCNAGITKDGLLARMKEEQFDRVIDVNLKGCFNAMRHAAPIMMRQRGGRIINIASVVGLYGNPGQVNYAASKAGIIGMTKAAAKELGSRGITVNAIAPGFIETEMTAGLSRELRDSMGAAVSLGRFGKPEEVAALAAFLASDEAGYITGQVIEIDGGLAM